MSSKRIAAAVLMSLAVAAPAAAERVSLIDLGDYDLPVAPVSRALEVAVTTGYAQGLGHAGDHMAELHELTGAGAALAMELGYRATPHWTLGAYGSVSSYRRGDELASGTHSLGATAGLLATFHGRPDRAIDPWVSVGAGWKTLRFDPRDGDGMTLQGFELARVQTGIDYRVSRGVAIGPSAGASLGMFEGQAVHVTAFAGVAGRFDLGGR